MKKIYGFIVFLAFVLFLSSCAGSHRSGYDVINYGKYPKSIVSDKNTISALNELDEKSVNSLGYYEYEGKEYAKITANVIEDSETYFSDNSPVKKGKVYYFLVEPISWRIMNQTDNEYTLISEYVLTVTKYDQVGKDIKYDNSQLRSYLNSSFLTRAFSGESKSPIKTKIGIAGINSSSIVYIEDSVWIPSVEELNADNGFFHVDDKYVFTTDYSRAMGASLYLDSPNSYYYNTTPYPTRTYFSVTDSEIFCIDYFGKSMVASDEYFPHCSVRPCITLSK